MRGRIRLLLALAFAALLLLLPAPDRSTGHAHLAYLRVREWLLDPVDSPLLAWQRGGRLPELQVGLRLSPPIEDPELLRQREQDYTRVAHEWAAVRTQSGLPTSVDAALGTLVMLVRVGSAGVQAEVAAPDGGTFTLVRPFASRWSLLPIGLAIVLAVATRRVLLALLAGGLGGAVAHVATAVPGSTPGVFEALRGGAAHYFADALWRRSVAAPFGLHFALGITFVFLTNAVLTKNGSLLDLVRVLQRFVRGPASAQFCSCASGILLCFDELGRCVLGGATMRPLCDAARVSREKLAYLVDATAAPLAALVFVSPWVAREVAQYRPLLAQVAWPDGEPGAFVLAPLRFYCLFTLALAVLVIGLRRDFGPMLTAERRARHGDAATNLPHVATEPAPGRAANAVVPLLVLVLGTVAAMLFGHARSDEALLWASIASFAAALLLPLAQRAPSRQPTPGAARRSARLLGRALGLLFLAWGLGQICRDLGTSTYLSAAAQGMHAVCVPALWFLLAGSVAFATGTGFGTIAVLLPSVAMLAQQAGAGTAFAASGATPMLLLCAGAVLEGAVFGEHCSPISNTSLFSSLGAQCDHLAHVTTQLPYALLALATAALCGYVPMLWLGPQWWPAALLAGTGAMATALRSFGRDAALAGPTSRS